jgi:hypothetical protein
MNNVPCSGSVTSWHGSGSQEPAFFVSDLQDTNNNKIFLVFWAYYFLKVHLHQSSKIKSHKEVDEI